MGLARQLAGEWLMWLAAVRALPDNPVARYLLITTRRRRKSVPVLRRFLLQIALVVAIAPLLGYCFFLIVSPANTPAETTLELWLFALFLLTGTLLVVGLRHIAAITGDLLRMLAQPGGGSRRCLLDETLAVSPIEDREVVLGVLRIYAPRFAKISIGGGLLAWLWLATYHLFDGGLYSLEFSHALFTAPLTILSIAFSGILGALALALWLLCLGRGSSGLYGATTAGILFAAGHLAFIPLIIGLTSYSQFSLYYDNGGPSLATWLGYRLVVLVLFIAGYELLLSDAVRRRRASSVIATLSPLILPVMLVITVFYAFGNPDFESSLRVLPLALAQAWAGMVVFNPMAVVSSYCLGTDVGRHLNWVDLDYPLLIVQQVMLILIGIHKARQAVTHWRQRLA